MALHRAKGFTSLGPTYLCSQTLARWRRVRLHCLKFTTATMPFSVDSLPNSVSLVLYNNGRLDVDSSSLLLRLFFTPSSHLLPPRARRCYSSRCVSLRFQCFSHSHLRIFQPLNFEFCLCSIYVVCVRGASMWVVGDMETD